MDGQIQMPSHKGFTQQKLFVRIAVALVAASAILGAHARSFAESTTRPATAAFPLLDVAGPALPAAPEKTPLAIDTAVKPSIETKPAPKEMIAPEPAAAPSVSAAEKNFTSSPLEQSPIRRIPDPKDIVVATPTTAPAPTGIGLPSGLTNALQVGAALAVVIGLVFLGKAAAKKFLPQARTSNGKNVIEVLARYPLSKNQSLVLVRIGSQIVTLNQGKDASQSVLVISDPTEVAKILGQIDGQSPNSIQSGFNKLLANARMDLEDPSNDPDRDDFELRSMEPENLDSQLDEMAAAKRQLMELRQQVRSVRDSLPRA